MDADSGEQAVCSIFSLTSHCFSTARDPQEIKKESPQAPFHHSHPNALLRQDNRVDDVHYAVTAIDVSFHDGGVVDLDIAILHGNVN